MDITVLASGSTGNCYHISDGKTRLLLDAGIPIRRIRVGCKFQLHQVSGCLVTHCHGDHSKAVKDLLCACVPVYLPEGEAQALSLTAAGRPLHYPRKEADGYGVFSIGTFRILPFRVEHDTPEPVGYLIGSADTGEKLLYFTDTFYLRYRFTGLTISSASATMMTRHCGSSTAQGYPGSPGKAAVLQPHELEKFPDFSGQHGHPPLATDLHLSHER